MTTIASTAPRRGYDPARPLTRASSAGGPTSFGWASVGPATLTMVVFFLDFTVPFAGPSGLNSTGVSTSSQREASTSLRSAPRHVSALNSSRLTGSASGCPSPTVS